MSSACAHQSQIVMEPITTRKVFVIYTGGTIAMLENDEGNLAPVSKEVLTDWLFRHLLLYEKRPNETEEQARGRLTVEDGWLLLHQKAVDDYDKDFKVLYQIESLDPPIDSSKMTPSQWFEIGDKILAAKDDYDGFVILHGTDTMAYTSSALSFILWDLKKPVILTGSQRSLFHPRSNAEDNFIGALLMASCYSKNQFLQQVMIYDDTKLYQGNRVCKYDCDSYSVYDSPNAEPLARLESLIKVRECKPMSEPKELRVRGCIESGFPDVRLLKVFPGIKAEYVTSILNGAHGLILETFGSGNAPDDPHLIAALKDADERGVVILNCTQVYKGTVLPIYDVSSELREAVVSGYDITPEAALAKMVWTLRTFRDQKTRKAVLEASICGETSAPPAKLIFE
ncbi:L-asparaginase 1-like [Clupea harengus]|uniref:asparaginase n=1 Tax=Clupea harengus TaxID=7950 RepID=A0A8M1KGT1_CLUHA|nr:L-asparaginase 1-like [Clupea harengus]